MNINIQRFAKIANLSAILLISSYFCLPAVAANQELLDTPGYQHKNSPKLAKHHLQQKHIHVNVEMLENRSTPIPVTLFNGSKVNLVRTGITKRAPGNFTWTGKVEGKPTSEVILSAFNGKLSGHIRIHDTTNKQVFNYQIQSTADGEHYLRQIDETSLPGDHPGDTPRKKASPEISFDALPTEPAPEPTPEPAPEISYDEITATKVMVVYSNQLAAKNNPDGMSAQIQALVDQANSVFANSKASQRLVLVHQQAVDYNENASIAINLNRLYAVSDTYMDDVPTLRNQYRADIVVLLTDGGESCGVSYQTPAESYAYSVVRFDCATTDYSFVHEIGHIYGARHEATADPGLPAYAHAYINTVAKWRTVMATAAGCGTCIRIGYFSSPTNLYNGLPLGTSPNPLKATDPSSNNARVLNENAKKVADFRLDPKPTTITIPVTKIAYASSAVVTASSGNTTSPIAFEVFTPPNTTPLCSITPVATPKNSVRVTGEKVGTCQLVAKQAGDQTWAYAENTLSITIVKAKQTLSFEVFPSSAIVGDGPSVSVKRGESTGAVTFSASPATVCTLIDAGNADATTRVISTSAVGTCAVNVSQATDTNYEVATISQSFTIGQGNSYISFNGTPASAQYNQTTPLKISTSGSTKPLVIGITSTTASICDLSGNITSGFTIKGKAIGKCTIRVSKDADTNYKSVTLENSIDIVQADQTIQVKLQVAGLDASSVKVNEIGNFVVTGASTPAAPFAVLTYAQNGSCELASPTSIKGLAGGRCVVDMHVPGNTFYKDAIQAFGFDIVKLPQTLSKGTLPTFQVGATVAVPITGGASGVAVTLTSLDPACTTIGLNIKGNAAGSCRISANQAGNAQYLDAPTDSFTVTIQPGLQQLSIGNVPALKVNDVTTLAATSNQPATTANPIVFKSNTPGTCEIVGNQLTARGFGTCTILADQTSDGNYLAKQASKDISIAKGTQSLTFGTLPTIRVAAPAGLITATSTHPGPIISFLASPSTVCTIDSNNMVTGKTAGICTITANQPGDANFDPAPEISTTLNSLMGEQTITFPQIGAILVGTGNTTLVASSSAGLPITFTATPSDVCTVSGNSLSVLKAGQCIVTAAQTNDSNYLPASTLQTVTVLPPAAQIVLTSGANPVLVRKPVTLTSNVTGNTPTGQVTFLVDGAPIATCNPVAMVAGKATCTTSKLKAGKRSIVASYSGDSNNSGSQSAPFVQTVRSLDWLPPLLNQLLN